MSAIIHAKSVTIGDTSNTDLVRPTDWNSGHVQVATLGGNTVGASTLSGTNFIFAGGNNVTLSGVQGVDIASITISAGADTVDQISISAGTTSGVLGSLVFANANGISFGLDGSTISGSHNALTSQSNQAFSAAGGSSAFQTLSFNNANGVSFSNNGGAVEASIATSLSNIRVSGGTTSNLLSAITFADSNGVSFGLNGSVMTATVQTNYLTTARASTDAIGLNTAQTNVTWTVNSAGLSLNAAGYAGTNTTFNGANVSGSMTVNSGGVQLSLSVAAGGGGSLNISAGTTSNNLTAVTFADSNGISFGLNGSVVTGTVATNYQSQGAYLTTARASNDAIGLATAQSNVTWTVNSAGLSLDARGYAGTGTTFNGASLSGSMTVNSNGVQLSLSAGAYLTTAMLSNAVTISNIRLSGGTTSNLLSAVTFGNANGVSFGLDGSTMTASIATSLSNIRISGGTTSNLLSAITFGDANGISFGLNASTMTASHNALTSQSNQNVTAANGGFAFQTLSFSNANGVSFGTSAGSAITASHNGLTTQSNQQMTLFATGNTTQSSTGTTNASSMIFRGEGLASIGITGGSVVISVPAGAPSPVNFSAGTTSGNLGSVVFGDANRVSFGLDGATITAQHALNFSAGTTSQNVSDQLVFSNSNGVSFGLNGSTITASVAAAGGGATLSSYENMPLWGTSAVTFGVTSLSSAVAFGMPQPGSFSFIRIPVLMTMGSTTIATIASATATAQMGQSSTFNAVVYSVGSGASSKSLMSVASGSGSVNLSARISITNSTQGSYTLAYSGLVEGAGTTLTTQYSVSNTNYSFTSQAFAAFSSNRFLDIPFANSLPAGNYWLIVGRSTSSSSAGVALSAITSWGPRYSNHYAGTQGNLAFGVMGSTNMTSVGALIGAGVFSTAGGGTTANLPISAISSTASNPRMYFQMLRSA